MRQASAGLLASRYSTQPIPSRHRFRFDGRKELPWQAGRWGMDEVRRSSRGNQAGVERLQTERKPEVELESRLLESSQKLQRTKWTKCTVKAGASRPRARENCQQKPVPLREAGDGMRPGDAKEGKGQGI